MFGTAASSFHCFLIAYGRILWAPQDEPNRVRDNSYLNHILSKSTSLPFTVQSDWRKVFQLRKRNICKKIHYDARGLCISAASLSKFASQGFKKFPQRTHLCILGWRMYPFFCSFVLQTHFMNWVMLKTIRWDWFPGHKQEDKEEQMRRHGLWNENFITTTKDSI